MPVSLFDVSPGFVRPVVLSEPELDLLPKLIMLPIFNENREIKETKVKVEEEKKAELKKDGRTATSKTATNTAGMGQKVDSRTFSVDSKSDREEDDAASNINGKGVSTPKSTNEQRKSDACAKFAKEFANFKMDVWNGIENEPKQRSMNDAQSPRGLTDDVKVEKCVEGQSVGKTP